LISPARQTRARRYFSALTLAHLFLWAASVNAEGQAGACPTPEARGQTLAEAGKLLGQSRFSGVIALLGTLAGTPCDPRIPLLLSGAYEGMGDLSNAQALLEDAHAHWPGDTAISTSLARAWLARGESEKAVLALREFRVGPSTARQELEEAAVVFIAAHRLEDAQTVARAMYSRDPSIRSLLLLANVLQLQGRYKDANQLLGAKRAIYADSAPFLITAAESQFDAMLYAAARSDLERAIQISPNVYQAHFLLGNVLLAQNDRDAAAAEYRTAIRLAPGQPRSYYQLALLSRQAQDESVEQQYLAQALAADPRYEPAYTELGRLLVDQHKYADAIEQLKLAISFNPSAEQAYLLLSRAYASLGNREKSADMAASYARVREANRRSFVDSHPGQLGASTSDRSK
jgi:tetratricopeptide (TPR) repeat protein